MLKFIQLPIGCGGFGKVWLALVENPKQEPGIGARDGRRLLPLHYIAPPISLRF